MAQPKRGRKMTIEEVQSVELGILKTFHAFCEAHGLRYYMYYGSLIGAIRHNGPIPWDDDVDVAMPRSDYDRLVKEWSDNDELMMVVPERGNCWARAARICDRKRTIVEMEYVSSPNYPDLGVWLDVIVIDGVDTEGQIWAEKLKRMQYLRMKINVCRRRLPYCFCSSILRSIKRLLIFFLYRFMIKSWLNEYDQLCRSCAYDRAEFVGSIYSLDYVERGIFPKAWVEEVKLVPYANISVYVPQKAHELLVHMYGDYMTPPPVEERGLACHYLAVYEKIETEHVLKH